MAWVLVGGMAGAEKNRSGSARAKATSQSNKTAPKSKKAAGRRSSSSPRLTSLISNVRRRDLVYYSVPPAVVVRLGVPPAGHRYVRVANDILLIAIGTRIVVDAIEDLMKF